MESPQPGPRQRIMDAALELAAEGGYDALQVRAITQRAGVSSRTIYSYFPSLDSLLIFAVAERAGEELFRHVTRESRRKTPARRVERVVEELNVIMRANRTLTAALLRALLCGKPDVAPHVRNFSIITQAMFARAVAEGGEPSEADLEIGAILESVWFSALIGWAIGSDPDERMPTVMKQAIDRVVVT